jgi:HAD superfamily hydrolase (TIGR01509 family)
MRFDAAIFDCDGTLIDSEPCWTRAEEVMFAQHGREFSAEEKARLIGASLVESGRVLAELLGEPGRAPELGRELFARARLEISRGVKPMPGAVRLVEDLDCLWLAIASGCPRDMVELELDRAGIRSRFQVVVTADDVAEPKPAPDVYRRACRLLDVAPSRAVAFEDSSRGVAAGRAAGLTVVGIPSIAEDIGADFAVTDMNDPNLRRFLAL